MIQSSVLNFNYFMLLGRSWLRDIKVSRDWGTNTITIQGTNTVRTMLLKNLEHQPSFQKC
jgi:hypothetical protein